MIRAMVPSLQKVVVLAFACCMLWFCRFLHLFLAACVSSVYLHSHPCATWRVPHSTLTLTTTQDRTHIAQIFKAIIHLLTNQLTLRKAPRKPDSASLTVRVGEGGTDNPSACLLRAELSFAVY